MTRTIKTDGIVLQKKSMFEKDIVIECITPYFGKIKCIAKGAKSSKRISAGILDPFTRISMNLYRGKSFNTITSVDCLSNFPLLRNNYNLLSLSWYFCDILSKATVFEQHNDDLFKLLLRYLNILNSDNLDCSLISINELKRKFQTDFLECEGLLCSQDSEENGVNFHQKFEDYSGKTLLTPQFI